MRDPKEQELLARLQAGEERALVELAATYGAKIYQLAVRYLKEPARRPAYRAARSHSEFLGNLPLSVQEIRSRLAASLKPEFTCVAV